MKNVSISLVSLIVLGGLFGCSAATEDGSSQSNRVVLDQRCSTSSDCPTGLQCEIETEHGITQSYCVSHQGTTDAAPVSCPSGWESEIEHGTTFCKPHSSGGSSKGDAGSDDDAEAEHDASSLDAGTVSCKTTADCPSGLECEIQTSQCKAHGGKK